MIRKALAYFLLFCHMNTSMFLPQMAENDVFDAQGNQIDDINTIIEYIDQVVLQNIDNEPEDEDDDSGQNFRLVKSANYYCHPQAEACEEITHTHASKQVFAGYLLATIIAPCYDIDAPPPKA